MTTQLNLWRDDAQEVFHEGESRPDNVVVKGMQ
jgi:hypothetical protein